ncbi:MAG: hypothetical protein JW873_03250 [Candidatus Saganbacteria bacterium]|nr:hypothetical protein [Candidatus Saganbacteria bacterium]
MRYFIDVRQDQLETINKLIARGKYSNLPQFAQAAIDNQIYLEGAEENHPPSKLRKTNLYNKNNFYDEVEIHDRDFNSLLMVPSKLPIAVKPPTFKDLGCSMFGNEEEACWLWGQTNKIFPIKLGLRVLLVLTNEWIELDVFKKKATEVAIEYGYRLRAYENKEGGSRDSKISAGLPANLKADSSQKRYQLHFLAYTRKDNKLDGAMSYLRFTNIKKNEKGRPIIGLTQAGIDFAKIISPVIDQQNYQTSLNIDEINYYLNHAIENVRGEGSAILWLLSTLNKGVNKREEINAAIRDKYRWGASAAVINTQRSGLMSRMYELGLILKEKDGINVNYGVSKAGEKLLTDIGA